MHRQLLLSKPYIPPKPQRLSSREVYRENGSRVEICEELVDMNEWDDEDGMRTDMTFRPHDEPQVSSRTILSLFDASGEWARPYREAGYQVAHIDLKNERPDPYPEGISPFAIMPQDVLEMDREWFGQWDLTNVWGVLAACPCTYFTATANRWKPAKALNGEMAKMMDLVDITTAIVEHLKPAWFAIENPARTEIHKLCPILQNFHTYTFEPCDFGHPYTKRTTLWGHFNDQLETTPVEPTGGSYSQNFGPSEDREYLRSLTFPGFAKAFFEANP